MYKVLIVDDEVLILSGIKYLIDWKKLDCNLVATANNGKQALELMDSLHPDIVISDINMPILNGLELLKESNKKHPLSTFIMLTCLEEFSLVKEALRNNAVEYLLKSELNEKNLIASIQRAKNECELRKNYIKININEQKNEEDDLKSIKSILSRINLPEPIKNKHINFLCSKGILKNYFVFQINIKFPLSDEETIYTKEDYQRMYKYQGELNIRLIKNFFPDNFEIEVSRPAPFAYIYFVYNVSKAKYETNLPSLEKKIKGIAEDITGVKSYLIATQLYESEKDIEECKKQLYSLRNKFFILEKSILGQKNSTYLDFHQIVFNAYIDRISNSLKNKNINDFRYYMNKIHTKLINYNYVRGDAIVFIDELISNALVSLKTEIPQDIEYPFNQNLLPFISTKSSFLLFFEKFNNKADELLIPFIKEKDSYIEKAKKYIFEHSTERIMLEDISNEIGVSSGYLSASFSKQCEISISEYINKIKVEKAIKMMKERPYKIYEICNELGFDNSYYFSRVFKKQTGKTLSAYMQSINYEKE